MLHRWVHEATVDGSAVTTRNGKLTPEKEELRGLRCEAAKLEAENGILTKVTAHFAKDQLYYFEFVAKHRGV